MSVVVGILFVVLLIIISSMNMSRSDVAYIRSKLRGKGWLVFVIATIAVALLSYAGFNWLNGVL